MTPASPTPPTADRQPRRAFSRHAAWIAGMVGLGGLTGVLVESFVASGKPLSMAMAFSGLYVSHFVFVTALFDAHSPSTRRGRLVSNLIFCVLFIVLFVVIYAALFAELGLRRDGIVVTGDFALALFFSVVTWTTVGYGDITAPTPASQLFAALEAMNGYFVMALFIAALTQTFQRMAGPNPDRPPFEKPRV